MKKLTLHSYREPFLIEDIKPAIISAREIRIKTVYAGISFTDIIIHKGYYAYQKKQMPLPLTLGFEASGIITEVGSEVTKYSVGEKVLVLMKSGCFSEEIVATAHDLIKIPDGITLDKAASLPVNFFTAWHAIHNIVKIFPNSRILITSAAGGVGGMLTQLTSNDHDVTGLVGSENKIAYASSIGAKKVFLYETFTDTDLFDVIFLASGTNLRKYIALLSTNGKIINYGFHDLVPRYITDIPKAVFKYLQLPTFKIPSLVYENKTISGFNIIKLSNVSNEYTSAKKAFEEHLASDTLKTPKITVFPYTEIKKAFEYLESRESIGKILLKF